MTRLSVNINKVALLRNSREINLPNVLYVAEDLVRMGAQGITVHPRPDERHIRKTDVYELAKALEVEFNVEGYPSEDFLQMMEAVKPDQCTLVPDPPGVLTSSEGWNTIEQQSFLQEVVARLKAQHIRTSLFMETDPKMIEAAVSTGTDRIELYTGKYAEEFIQDPEAAVAPFVAAGELAQELGLELNAGHDLNLGNLKWFKQKVPGLMEVSIGHALVADALYLGFEETVRRYLGELS